MMYIFIANKFVSSRCAFVFIFRNRFFCKFALTDMGARALSPAQLNVFPALLKNITKTENIFLISTFFSMFSTKQIHGFILSRYFISNTDKESTPYSCPEI